jgi:cytochrome c oxidase subunit 2
MNVELYERIWMWAAGALLAMFLGAIFFMVAADAVQPPGHVETVDPTTLSSHPEFGAPAVKVEADGTITASVVASMFEFTPNPIRVPVNRPVTFRLTSSDVLHGFEVASTNANVMAIPGYVTQFTVTFDKPGEYVIVCNEYCGLQHHNMVGKLIVMQEVR